MLQARENSSRAADSDVFSAGLMIHAISLLKKALLSSLPCCKKSDGQSHAKVAI